MLRSPVPNTIQSLLYRNFPGLGKPGPPVRNWSGLVRGTDFWSRFYFRSGPWSGKSIPISIGTNFHRDARTGQNHRISLGIKAFWYQGAVTKSCRVPRTDHRTDIPKE